MVELKDDELNEVAGGRHISKDKIVDTEAVIRCKHTGCNWCGTVKAYKLHLEKVHSTQV